MKVVIVVILCLIFQSRAEPFIVEAISDGAQFAGSLAEVGLDVASGVIGAGVDFISNLDKDSKSLSENEISNKILERALQKAQIALQQIQDGSREVSQANADAGNIIQKRIAYLKNTQQAKVRAVTGEAKKKLSRSSKEAQEKGQALLRQFSYESSKYLNKCIYEIVAQFRELQVTANAVTRQFQGPFNTLAVQVEKCTKLRATNSRGLVRCAIETQKALKPLEAVPMNFSWGKAHFARAAQQPLLRRTCVLRALAKFLIEADSVGKKIDQLVAEDKKKTAPKSQPNGPPETAIAEIPPAETSPGEIRPTTTAPMETDPAKSAPSAKTVPPETSPASTVSAEMSPAKAAIAESALGKTGPAEIAPADTAPSEKTVPAEARPAKTALAEFALGKTGPAETDPAETAPLAKTVPAETSPASTASAEMSPAKAALAESPLGKTAPAETASAETAPSAKTVPAEASPAKTALAESALGKTAAAETAPAETAPSAKTVPAEAPQTKIAPAATCLSMRNS